MSRFSAQESKPYRKRRSRRPNRSGSAARARIFSSCCRWRFASACAEQQPGQPGQDDDADVRDRRAGDVVCLEPDLVGCTERTGHDERVAALVLLARWISRVGDAPLGTRHSGAGVWHMSRRRWNQTLPQATDLPVLMPSATRIARRPLSACPAFSRCGFGRHTARRCCCSSDRLRRCAGAG